jgi:hypothetical protein
MLENQGGGAISAPGSVNREKSVMLEHGGSAGLSALGSAKRPGFNFMQNSPPYWNSEPWGSRALSGSGSVHVGPLAPAFNRKNLFCLHPLLYVLCFLPFSLTLLPSFIYNLSSFSLPQQLFCCSRLACRLAMVASCQEDWNI